MSAILSVRQGHVKGNSGFWGTAGQSVTCQVSGTQQDTTFLSASLAPFDGGASRFYNEGMNKETWRLSGLGWALAFLLLLGGCTARPIPTTQVGVVGGTPSPTPSAPNGAIRVVGRFTGGDEAAMRGLLVRFTEATGIPAEYAGAGEVAELLRVEVEAGAMPDVVLLPKVEWVGELAAAGTIPPLPDGVAATVRANFSPTWVTVASHEGTLYGVPFDANAKSLLWYRPEALAAVGAVPPTTLEELITLAAALEEAGTVPFAVPGGAGWPLTDWFENVLLATTGPDIYDALIRHEVAWNDPTVQAATEQWVALLRDEWLMGGQEGAATMPLEARTFGEALADGGAAMWLGQGSIVHGYAAESGLLPGEGYDFFPFPAEGGVIVIGSVAVATNGEPATLALLEFLAHPEAVEPWVRAGGFVSPNQAVPLAAYPTALARREAELLRTAPLFRSDLSDRLPPNLGYPFLGDTLREMLRHPDELARFLAEIERVAAREQGRVKGQSSE